MLIQTEKNVTPKEFIEQFQQEFQEKFGVIPTVVYDLGMTKIDVNFLLDTVNKVLNSNCPGLYEGGIKNRSRQQSLSEHRQMFFKIARDMGYSYSYLARFIGFDHATLIYSVKKVNHMIKLKDKIVIGIYQQIKDELYGKETIQAVGGPQAEPQSDLSAL
jgi:hypothetical protein